MATGRYDDAREILETFARFVDRGMLPNVFPGAGETPDYNTVDATLWFFEAWRGYLAATGDRAALRTRLSGPRRHRRLARNGARATASRVDPADGLLRAGEPGVQLTWMDARVGDWVVTPRIGKPVEINALWYNALCAMAGFAERLGRPAEPYRGAPNACATAFTRFVKPGGGGLYDVIDGPTAMTRRVRPNQILAVSLPASPLDGAMQRRVVGPLRRSAADLLRPALAGARPSRLPRPLPRRRRRARRRLSPGPGLGLAARPLGAWPITACTATPRRRRPGSQPIGDHLADAGLGQVSEIFDGDPPHLPRGAPAQAWSVACVLEAWWRLERAKSTVSPEHR